MRSSPRPGTSASPWSRLSDTASRSGITHEYRGRVFQSRFLPKAHLTFVVSDELAEKVLVTVADAARTGHVSGDGICWMSPVTNVTHNRTGAKLEEVEAQ